MNVGQYRSLLSGLEVKKAEVVQVHDQYAFGYALTVLANARDKVQAEIDELLSLELMPVPTVVSILVAPASPINLTLGGTSQLTVTAKLSDGSSKDVTKEKYAYASFKDYDTMFNNIGYLTGVDVEGFMPAESRKYRVVKTATGWNVYDDVGTDGLAVSATANPNEYKIVDIDGADIGVVFTTDGNEVKGDNWTIDVTVALTGTTYTSLNEAVVGVDGNGLISAIGAGTTNVTITNNGATVNIEVTVA